jgi:hypothetical protein
VTNAGDLTILNPTVSFYLGNPAAGGSLLGTADISPATLKAGETGLAQLPWTIPANITVYSIYAVADAGAGVVEDETNNTIYFDVIKPDLRAVRCILEERPDGSTALRAEIRNDGLRAAENVLVLFKAQETAIGTMSIPGILPGKSAEVVFPADLDLYGYTTLEPLISVTADPQNQIPEISEDNNTTGFIYSLTPSAQDFGEVHYDGAMGTVTVFNKTTSGLSIGEISFSGSDAGEFRIFDNPLTGTTLGAQQSGLLGIAFYPTSLGVKNALLVIKDDQGRILWQVSLTGQLDFLIPGDVNDDTLVDMADAILALQAVAGLNPAGINHVVDVDGDGKIGIAEAIHAIQTEGGMR